MKKALLVCGMVSVLLVAGCSENQQTDPVIEQPETTNVQENTLREVIAENLASPWSIAKAEQTFYVTERGGSIVKIEDGEMERQQVQLEKELATASEAGLLGFVLAPDFAETGIAYAYYTYEDGSGQYNRIVTMRLENGLWREEQLLLDQIPSGSFHHGGRIKIGPDGKLYATAGDASAADIAQEPGSLGGKILRLNLDGSIPDDNPVPDSYVYSAGHRNPQGLAWTSDGKLYASEHGNRANDEINLIEAGQNYGWPIIEGKEQQEGLISPIFTSGDGTTWAPSGMDVYENKLYVAALRGTAVLEFDLAANSYHEVITDVGRVRDIWIDGDDMYMITNNTDGRGTPQQGDDKLYKISLSQLNSEEK